MQIGELLSKLGGVTTDRQRRMEYLQRALAVFRELGARTRMRSSIASTFGHYGSLEHRPVEFSEIIHRDRRPIWIGPLRAQLFPMWC